MRITESISAINAVAEVVMPYSGMADTKAGEVVRAFERVAYRFWNDGDVAGVGYGRETVNPAFRFLTAHVGDEGVRGILGEMFGHFDEGRYEALIYDLADGIARVLDENPEWFAVPAPCDMWDMRDPVEDVDEDDEWEWDDDEEGWVW